MKRIIFTHGGGRLANQLVNFINLAAFYEEYKNQFEISNLSFAKYSDYFEYTANSNLTFPARIQLSKSEEVISSFHKKNGRLNRIILKNLVRWFHLKASIKTTSILVGEVPNHYALIYGQRFKNMDLTESLNLLENNQTAICGWPIRCWDLVEKHIDKIRDYIKLESSISSKTLAIVDGWKTDYDLMIGVFMRASDYKTFLNGKFYFPQSAYSNWCREIKKIFTNKKILFILSSDDKINTDLFEGMNYKIVTGEPHGVDPFIFNFAELSLCDSILSPPSTFGCLCSAVNNKTLITVSAKDQHVTFKDFLKNNLLDAIKHPNFSEVLQ